MKRTLCSLLCAIILRRAADQCARRSDSALRALRRGIERERARKAARASLYFSTGGDRKVDVHIGSVFPI